MGGVEDIVVWAKQQPSGFASFVLARCSVSGGDWTYQCGCIDPKKCYQHNHFQRMSASLLSFAQDHES